LRIASSVRNTCLGGLWMMAKIARLERAIFAR